MFAGPLCGVSGWFQLEFVHNVNAAEIGNGRTANEFERRLFLSDATNIHSFRFRSVRSFVRSSVCLSFCFALSTYANLLHFTPKTDAKIDQQIVLNNSCLN